MPSTKPFIVQFKDVDHDDIPLVGGKGANLGEMTKAGFPVPQGFIVTAPAYFHFINENKLKPKIQALIRGVDLTNTNELTRVSKQIKKLLKESPVPEQLALDIMKEYLKLGETTPVAVRSSATAEDLPDASFAGQQETFLNVVGETNVLERVRDAWASLFTPRAIFYREEKHYDHFSVGLAVPIQQMIQSDASGVMFTINPVNNDKSVVVVEGILGLGEYIVQGTVTPDHFEVLRRTMKITKKEISKQTIMLKRDVRDQHVENIEQRIPSKKQRTQKVSDAHVLEIAQLGVRLHAHYFFPQDTEWAIEKGHVYLIQTRPITTMAEIALAQTEGGGEAATKGLELLTSGDAASPGLVSGPAKVVMSIKEINKVKQGDVLVMEMTTPDFVPAMKKAVAIVTDQGGQTSHAAIVSRELGLTCVVGTQNATKKIKTGTIVTVNGLNGNVFKGAMHIQPVSPSRASSSATNAKKDSDFSKNLKTATKLYVNLAEPELAEKVAAENVDGVGLLRAEFMIAQIGIHPKKMIHDGKSRTFVHQLADGLATFAKAFHPRPVVYRATDFKTNEFRNLKGGTLYEPQEPNPMIGYRGAFRYMSDPRVFKLEIEAIKKARETYDNIHIMIPFVRSVRELQEVKKLMYTYGLKRSPTFKFWMMTEIPINVISIDDFISVGIDGISVGTNDLTMLTMGTDRDNEEIASEYNEMDPAILWSLERLITHTAKAGVTSSVCGQAPSVYPELTQMLVKWGITSISVAPDRINITRQLMYEAERKLIRKAKR